MRWRVSKRRCFRARFQARRGRWPMRSATRLAEDIVAPIDVPPFDRSNVDGFAVRSADLASAGEATPVRVALNDEVIACGIAPTHAGVAGHGDADCDRRTGAARRRCHRDGRTYPARGARRDRDSPRGVSGTIRLLCRLRHRARRGAAARRDHDRLARDRHARRLRHRRCRGGAEAARGRDLHRRRAGSARPAAAPRRDLRHQRRHRRRRRERERRRSGLSRRHPRR